VTGDHPKREALCQTPQNLGLMQGGDAGDGGHSSRSGSSMWKIRRFTVEAQQIASMQELATTGHLAFKIFPIGLLIWESVAG
jgi:hypothetical protein